jgi:hypothetical protein
MSWERLGDLARRERELVAAEQWDELIALQAARQQLIDSLPAALPREAKPVLEAALAQSRATQAALRAEVTRADGVLGALRRGRRAVSAYGVGGQAAVEARA